MGDDALCEGLSEAEFDIYIGDKFMHVFQKDLQECLKMLMYM